MINSRINHNTIIPERIKEARIARGYTTTELAEQIGITRQSISQYEMGVTSPSAMVMGEIIKTLNFPTGFFLKAISNDISRSSAIYFRSNKSAAKKTHEMLRIRMEWIEEIYKYTNKFINFPKVSLPNVQTDNTDFSEEDIEVIATEARGFFGIGLGPISNIALLLEKYGVLISKIQINDLKTDACSQWRNLNSIILMSSDKNNGFRSRFDLAHELGHLILHRGIDQTQLNDDKFYKKIEKEANYFAAAFLLPRDSFMQEVYSTSIEHFMPLKLRWKVSIAAMIQRCLNLGIFNESQYLNLQKTISKRKMRTIEPLDDEIVQESPTLLKKAITLLFDNNIIIPSDMTNELLYPIYDIESLCNLKSGTLSLQGKVINIPISIKR